MMPRLFLLVLSSLFSMNMIAQSGSLDSTFSEDGIDIRDLGSSSTDISFAGTLQSDGKTLVVGWSAANGNTDFAIIRYLTDGSRDASFGNDGLVLADYNNAPNRGQAVTVQPDRKIILAGYSDISLKNDFTILRLHPDGRIDSTFGQYGWVITDLGTSFEYPNAVAVQTDGKIIVAGRVEEETFADFGMVRYHPDGQLDTLFGDKGIVITDFRDEDLANDILIQPNGQIILGGFSSVSAIGDFALARYNPDGSLDKSFGTGGKVLTDLEGFNQSDFINDLVLLDDGKIIAAGNANNNNLDFTSDIGIVRYDENGLVDETFGENGVVVHYVGGRTNVEGVAVHHDGKIIICGETDAFTEKRWFLNRFRPDGEVDPMFGIDGFVSTPFTGSGTFPNGVFLQPDTRIVVTGSAGTSPNNNFAAARYIADFAIFITTENISCYGAADGMITVEASGGVAPYGFSIDGVEFQAGNVFTGLAPGTYYFTILDSNGTGVTSTAGPYVISEPPAPPAVTIEAPSDGDMIYIYVNGNHDGFLYSIDGGVSFQTDSVFINLEDGIYSVLVLDANGCTIHTEDVLISTLGIASLQNTLPFDLSPNPCDGLVTLSLDNTSGNKLVLKVIDITGKEAYSSTLTETGPVNRKIDLRFLSNGMYQVWISNGYEWGTRKLMVVK